MPSVSWYLQRLRAMTPAEALWRAGCASRDAVRRAGLMPVPSPRDVRPPLAGTPDALQPQLRLLPEQLDASAREGAWIDALLDRADRIAAGRLTIFDLHDVPFDFSQDWNRDVKSGRNCPLQRPEDIDYRDFARVGDAKFVWEPNRHHHLVVLARAHRVNHQPRYAHAAVRQLESWLDACPFQRGMNWRSPLELAIRLINWVWTLELLRPGDELISQALRRRILESIYLHVCFIAERYSRGSSANNHLIGEAAGVYVATACFPQLPRADRLRRQALAIVQREIVRQVFADGPSREQACGYHLFTLQFFTIVAVVARACGDLLHPSYLDRLGSMSQYVECLAEGGDELPNYGDDDQGYVLDLGRDGRDPAGWTAAVATLLGSLGRANIGPADEEVALWLLGTTPRSSRHGPAPASASGGQLVPRAFPEAGHYLLQAGLRDHAERISVFIDCGPHGYPSIAAHAHADALSFTLRAYGMDVVVDPGTFDYFSAPAWRNSFRRTRAHSTVEIDGQDQSEMLGPFLWGRRAAARCLAWEPTPHGGRFVGEHDGYRRLRDPVLHRREVILDAAARTLVVRDTLLARAAHDVAWCLPLSEHCRVREQSGGRVHVRVAGSDLRIDVDPRLSLSVACGQSDPPAGWVSRGYHRRTPAPMLIGHARVMGNVTLQCVLRLGPAAPHAARESPWVEADARADGARAQEPAAVPYV